jgi:hypothetical protein
MIQSLLLGCEVGLLPHVYPHVLTQYLGFSIA